MTATDRQVEHMLRQFHEERLTLIDELRREVSYLAGTIESRIYEELLPTQTNVPATGALTTVDTVPAQTVNLELIEGIAIVLPQAAFTSITLTLGARVIPFYANSTILTDLALKIMEPTRVLTVVYPANPTATQGAWVALWGKAVPAAGAPNRLH